ncbi:uncharacterized protein [Macrobrachium rosenbergii]|uniref:uncharacterized protein n=1 Tax=Macrobrachium rosenbergii TaxID=79674 RepID=UPI0034D571CA
MDSQMDMECQSPAAVSKTPATFFSKGCLDMEEAGKIAMDHSWGSSYSARVNDSESLPAGDEPSGEQGQASDEIAGQDTMEELMYDKTYRRPSLGADSLFDQDFGEDCPLEDCECTVNLSAPETLLGLQYADDIYNMKKQLETKYHPTNCMADQPQVTEYMRCTLVHWLIKVNHKLQFGPETVFLAVNISDRFLALTPLAQDCLQLLAVASLYVAAKMEESIVPGISELVAMCGGTYKPHHFRLMEILILSTLEFVLYGPTSWYFIEHLTLKSSQTCPFDRRVVSIAKYVLETCLSNYEVSQFLPSVQAAGAMLMSINTVPCSPVHSETLQGLLQELYSADERQDITICSRIMSRYMTPFLSCTDADRQYLNNLCDSPKDPETEKLTHDQPPLRDGPVELKSLSLAELS